MKLRYSILFIILCVMLFPTLGRCEELTVFADAWNSEMNPAFERAYPNVTVRNSLDEATHVSFDQMLVGLLAGESGYDMFYLRCSNGRAKTLSVFGLAPGKQLPLPPADEALWQSLTFDPEPPAGAVADVLFPDRPARRDDFYSELCTKRNRGKAVVWALEQQGRIACTVGAYAMANGQAYMACGETVEPLRGKGIGGRLIVRLANSLSAQGLWPLWLCSPERVPFYTRLGFAKLGEYARYEAP